MLTDDEMEKMINEVSEEMLDYFKTQMIDKCFPRFVDKIGKINPGHFIKFGEILLAVSSLKILQILGNTALPDEMPLNLIVTRYVNIIISELTMHHFRTETCPTCGKKETKH